MSYSRVQTVFTYKSYQGPAAEYLYDILIDANDLVAVRNIRGPRGLITDSLTDIPEPVVRDIQDSIGAAQLLVREDAAHDGSLTFNGVTDVTESIPDGLLNTEEYRVYYSTPDGVVIRTTSKSVTSFTASTPLTYGTEEAPVVVDYVIYVSPLSTSVYGGQLTFTADDAGSKTVTFPLAMPSTRYRVLVSADTSTLPVFVSTKTRQHFVLTLGVSLQEEETLTVNYDVLV